MCVCTDKDAHGGPMNVCMYVRVYTCVCTGIDAHGGHMNKCVCVCVCVCMCVFAQMRVYMVGTCMWKPKANLGCLPRLLSPLCLLRQGLELRLELPDSASLTLQVGLVGRRRSLVFTSWVLG